MLNSQLETAVWQFGGAKLAESSKSKNLIAGFNL